MVTQFGSGQLWAVPTLKQGAAVANPTPQCFGTLQDVQVDFGEDIKELHGQYKFPVDVAAGKGKITGKAKWANLRGSMLAELYFNETVASTLVKQETSQTAAIPTTPFQITVSNGATFFRDLGVQYAATGLYLTRVAAAPVAGQYTVTGAGVYTFAAAETGTSVIINYVYTVSTGKVFTVNNRLMGDKPEFELFLIQDRKGLESGIRLARCISNKLSWATKLDDFTIPEFDFTAFADASNVIGEVWSPE